MVCRGTLPGIVFTAALAPVLFDAGQIAGSAIYGSAAAAEIDWFTYSFLRNGTILLCAAGVVLTVRAFLRLEATEASGLRTWTYRRSAWVRRCTSASSQC
ncbi:MAG TPA: hypothetical protein VFK20_14695 [Vicinamibacterales bacterium]|nr:hypothetical protein [Vicinamibacterales bacterium]